MAYGKNGFGYANFIGYGYTSCLTCHYNAFGNGPLNDYGRALGANTIAGRTLIPKSISDEKLSEYSGFFGKHLTKFVRPSIDYRGFRYTRNAGKGSSEESNWVHMQMDANLILKFMQDKLIFSITGGKNPKYSNRFQDVEYEDISREHYIMYAFTPRVRLYLGKMDYVFGLRIPDHIAYSRAGIDIAQNDQTHGGAVHYFGDKWEGGLHLFVGDLAEEESLQEGGLSFQYEYSILPLWRVGVSFLNASNEFKDRDILSVHSKLGLAKGMSVLAEIGSMIKKETISNIETETESNFAFIQSQYRMWRGMHYLMTFETLSSQPKGGNETTLYRFTNGFQWFPLQRFEFRFEVANTRTFTTGQVSEDSWSIFNQVHLWF